jgi:hypothetical protein
MLGARMALKDGFSRWLGGLGRLLGKAARDGGADLGKAARPAPRDEAEAALWQAMGWSEPDAEDAVKAAAGKMKKALAQG